ncbi:hypothetical protein DFP72DRAFT_1064508 [Ephemerocybe angulata]|uniref:RING-type domain-containing protein n=1 Tax=Ephemerocybe angulata TaxID=980116 RepID=A0A8H6I6X4_9AGAR|nr:hypothetical protein DFP72DRAFT_1064508 [Tulosesus angulatus]
MPPQGEHIYSSKEPKPWQLFQQCHGSRLLHLPECDLAFRTSPPLQPVDPNGSKIRASQQPPALVSKLRPLSFGDAKPIRILSRHHSRLRLLGNATKEVPNEHLTLEIPNKEGEQNVEASDDKTLQGIIKAVEDAGTCTICTFFMSNPYTLGCGHTFCGRCILRAFEASFLVQVCDMEIEDHEFHDWDECQSLPTCEYELKRLFECIEEHKKNPTDYLRYPCPGCKEASRKAPRINQVLRDTLDQMVTVLDGRFVPEVYDPTDPHRGIVSFDLLFLTETICKKLGEKKILD